MNPKPWGKAVNIKLGVTGRYRAIASTKEAAECLLYEWPGERGPDHLLARTACISVLGGHAPSDYARDAFIKAAKEAGLAVKK